MQAVWFSQATNKEAMEQSLRSFLTSEAGKRFMELLDKQISSVDAQELTVQSYDSPSWSHKQAHLNGFRQAIKQVKLLFLDNKEKTK